jgi:hypothetical protein
MAHAFTVCHAIIIAITEVFPAPVAIFRATRISSGFDCSFAARICAQNLLTAAPRFGATSVSQIAVSTASI